MQNISIKEILNDQSQYNVKGTLWIECNGERFFGPGRVELLENIDKTGSIKKAAQQMEMSYKKAWAMVSSMNTQATMPFVVTQTGGEKGGGSLITEAAKQMIAFHQLLRQRFINFLETETNEFKALQNGKSI